MTVLTRRPWMRSISGSAGSVSERLTFDVAAFAYRYDDVLSVEFVDLRCDFRAIHFSSIRPVWRRHKTLQQSPG